MATQVSLSFVQKMLERVMPSMVKDAGYVEALADELDNRIGLFVVDELGPESLPEYSELVLKGGTPEQLQAYLKKTIPDFESKRTSVFEDFAKRFMQRNHVLNKQTNS